VLFQTQEVTGVLDYQSPVVWLLTEVVLITKEIAVVFPSLELKENLIQNREWVKQPLMRY
jgi:hypothetical protein